MKVIYSIQASEAIEEIVDFIDDVNIEGAGGRWLKKLIDFIASYAQPNATYSLCYYKLFANEEFSCISFNNWVIVFKIESKEFVVYQIVHASILA